MPHPAHRVLCYASSRSNLLVSKPEIQCISSMQLPPIQPNHQPARTHNKHYAASQNQGVSWPVSISHKQCRSPFSSMSLKRLGSDKPNSCSCCISFGAVFPHNCPDRPWHPAGPVPVGLRIIGHQQLHTQTQLAISTRLTTSYASPASRLHLPYTVQRPTTHFLIITDATSCPPCAVLCF